MLLDILEAALIVLRAILAFQRAVLGQTPIKVVDHAKLMQVQNKMGRIT